jgi:hypothetical protein
MKRGTSSFSTTSACPAPGRSRRRRRSAASARPAPAGSGTGPACRRRPAARGGAKVPARCSASTQRTPKPSSAHSTLPMPSTTMVSVLSPPPVTGACGRNVGLHRLHHPRKISGRRVQRPRAAARAQRLPGLEAVPLAACSASQSAAGRPKASAQRMAVSGVIARWPCTSFVQARRDMPSTPGGFALRHRSGEEVCAAESAPDATARARARPRARADAAGGTRRCTPRSLQSLKVR